jgi:hypothetical protein
MSDELYYIRNWEYVGCCALWWRPNAKGYTVNLDEAGKYTEKQAKSYCATHWPRQDFMYPCSAVEPLAVRHVTELPNEIRATKP